MNSSVEQVHRPATAPPGSENEIASRPGEAIPNDTNELTPKFCPTPEKIASQIATEFVAPPLELREKKARRFEPNVGGDFAQGTVDPFWRLKVILQAPITPAACKLVLLILAWFGDANGTNCRPAIATVAAMCGVTAKQARRYVIHLQQIGVLTMTRAAAQHRPAVYAINFSALPRAPMEGSAEGASPPADGSAEAARAPVQGRQASHTGAPDLPPMGAYPGNDPGEDPQPRGGGAPAGPGFAGPVGVSPKKWDDWIATRKRKATQAQVDALVEEGNRLAQQGHSLNALIDLAMRRGLIDWPRPEGRSARPVKASHLGGSTAADYGVLP
jgi:hypothetical protein